MTNSRADRSDGATPKRKWASAIYEGKVTHRRFSPRDHRFTYPLFMMYLDLDEIDEIFDESRLWSSKGSAPARFDRRDFLPGESEDRPLAEAVRDAVEKRIGDRPPGPVRVLTHLRYFGFIFNPVRFYYCFEADGETLHSTLAEVHNTPWDEVHYYVLSDPAEENRSGARFDVPKKFHVSPFMPMNQRYAWWVAAPGERLFVHMQNHQDGERVFDASLSLDRREITGKSLRNALLRFPWMTARVVFWIYLQAGLLWLRRVPFHTHPKKLKTSTLETAHHG